MRFLIPLSLLIASALGSASNFNDLLGELYGDCGAACAVIEFKDSSANCGDPSSSSSNACYCKNYINIFSDVDAMRFGTCISKCNLDISSLDYDKIGQSVDGICGSDLGADTTVTGALPSSTGSSSSGTESGSGTTSTPTPTPGAASTIGSSKAALALGALAFLGYAL